jgi:uncharacterized repeat protein (TIGR03847 family)
VKYLFESPDKVMIGTRGEVGSRLFLLQVREGRRLVVVKCEKLQLAAIAEWVTGALESLGRPGHLPDDLALEAEYEIDFTVGEITLSLEEDDTRVRLEALSDDEEHSLDVVLTREWAGALAIAITRLVEAGRPPCPLCGYPLDPRGHDCPRTNGNRPPLR